MTAIMPIDEPRPSGSVIGFRAPDPSRGASLFTSCESFGDHSGPGRPSLDAAEYLWRRHTDDARSREVRLCLCVCDLDYSSRCECAANHRYGQHHMRPISGRFGGDLAAYFQRSPVSAEITVSRVDFLALVSASKNSVPGDWVSRPGGARESAAGR
jgi:hypothetical protein